MGRFQVMLLDLDSAACRTGACQRVPGLIRKFFPPERMEVTVRDSIPADLCRQPDIVLLRPPFTECHHELPQLVRRRWTNAALIGVVCVPGENLSDLANYVEDFDDFLSCPLREIDLIPRIQTIAHRSDIQSMEAISPGLQARLGISFLIGESPAFQLALSRIVPAAQAKAHILLSGETGTGKELFARAIHQVSRRKDKSFIAVNCGALPEHLVENELFGHARGAYTDASCFEKGLLAAAEGGTLFLDEVDALSSATQVKLLRFLQDREYRPLGSPRSIVADVRIISASNVDLRARVRDRQFREDLYYRLNILNIDIPPLRERITDVPLLARHFTSQQEMQNASGPRELCREAVRKLLSYSWPGNVRELEGVIQRALTWTSAGLIRATDIELATQFEVPSTHPGLPLQQAKNEVVKRFVRSYLVEVLAQHKGNISQAAVAAKKDRRSFQRLLRSYGLNPSLSLC